MIKSFFIIFLLSSCQNYNSNSSDRSVYGPVILNEADPNFAQAYNIIQNRCISCHSSNVHNVWATYTNNAAWIDSGMISNLPENSYFMQRIINSGGSGANMPQGGSALPNQEYETLKKWILEMNQ